jgi:flagellin-like protein
MKGITPIIAIVILLLITVAIAGAGYSYISMYTGGLMNRQVEITGATCTDGLAKIMIKNIGTDVIDTGDIKVMDSRTGADITGNLQWSSGSAGSSKVLEYRLEEGAGTVARDTSGGRKDGTLTNGPVWTTAGRIGGALNFNGVDQGITIGSLINISQMDFSMGAWFMPVSNYPNDHAVIGTWRGDWAKAWICVNNNNIYLYISNGSTSNNIVNCGTFVMNNWYHVVFVGDWTKRMTMCFVNGVNTANGTFPVNDVSNHWGVGQMRGWEYKFNGTIDEAAVWDRALSGAEVKEVYDNRANVTTGDISTFTHICSESVCQYSIVFGGSVKGAYVNC